MVHSIEEKSTLVQFRNLVSDIALNADDDYLIRWLRARELNVEKAKEMLIQNLEWRKNNPQLENLSNWMPPDEIYGDITYDFTGFDLCGHPVLFMPIGIWNMRKLIEDGFKEEIFQYLYKIMEEILSRIEKAKNLTGATQIVAVFDVTGLTLWKIASIETMQAVNRFINEFESYYPEILSKVYVINAHWVFYYGFKMVKHLMSPNTVSKIEILTDKASWKEVLQNTMPADCIPPKYEVTGESVKKHHLMKHISCPP